MVKRVDFTPEQMRALKGYMESAQRGQNVHVQCMTNRQAALMAAASWGSHTPSRPDQVLTIAAAWATWLNECDAEVGDL